jgi:hypothetical protein
MVGTDRDLRKRYPAARIEKAEKAVREGMTHYKVDPIDGGASRRSGRGFRQDPRLEGER